MLITVPNLENRHDRKSHIIEQLSSEKEFDLQIVKAIKDKSGAIGLWKTLKYILTEIVKKDVEYFVFCEDDHEFTEDYNIKFLKNCIKEASIYKPDILLGGVSWFDLGLEVSENLFWVKTFSGNQFVIIFKRFYNKILQYKNFTSADAADFVISSLSDKKFLITPFISIQKEFGYSDVTTLNNHTGRVNYLFDASTKKIDILKKVNRFYAKLPFSVSPLSNIDDFVIPVYKIQIDNNYTHVPDPDFKDKGEFELFTVSSTLNDYWSTIQKCVQSSLDKGDDLLIICNESHMFTQEYDKFTFINNILLAYQKKCQLLLGGLGSFNYAVPVSKNLLWIDHFFYNNLLVIYKGCYEKILNTQNEKARPVDDLLSKLTSQKMVVCPFISTQKKNENIVMGSELIDPATAISQQYQKAENRLNVYKTISAKYPRNPSI